MDHARVYKWENAFNVSGKQPEYHRMTSTFDLKDPVREVKPNFIVHQPKYTAPSRMSIAYILN